jgi:sigma-E factor negative regulatory protein RseC
LRVEIGIVIEIEGGRAVIQLESGDGCGACAAKESCMIGSDATKRSIKLNNIVKAKKGDMISFSVEEKGVVYASLILYVIPVIFLLLGMAIGVSYNMGFEKDLSAGIGGFIGLIFALILIRIFTEFSKKKSVFIPEIIEIVSKKSDF